MIIQAADVAARGLLVAVGECDFCFLGGDGLRREVCEREVGGTLGAVMVEGVANLRGVNCVADAVLGFQDRFHQWLAWGSAAHVGKRVTVPRYIGAKVDQAGDAAGGKIGGAGDREAAPAVSQDDGVCAKGVDDGLGAAVQGDVNHWGCVGAM